jgi:hypothetical protein
MMATQMPATVPATMPATMQPTMAATQMPAFAQATMQPTMAATQMPAFAQATMQPTMAATQMPSPVPIATPAPGIPVAAIPAGPQRPVATAPPVYSASPTVGKGQGTVPYNTRQMFPYEPTSDSATIDVYTGIMDEGKMTKLRERAIYDINALSYAPLADTGTGVLFPGAVQAKTEIESALRIRPTTFKGPQQLDLAEEQGDVFFNRQFHPNGTNMSDQTWYLNKGDIPFKGYPNPDLFYSYMEAIPTHNIQNLSHSKMTEALRTTGDEFNHNEYLSRVGSLLKTDALSGPAHASIEHVVQSDGGGINGDPRLLERMYDDYEKDFVKAQRIRVAEATNDPRFAESAPGIQYTQEQHFEQESKETQFNLIGNQFGIGSSYTKPEIFRVG